MRTEYKRDLDHSYMILQEISQIDTSSYQIRMLAANVIPKLLKCRIQGVDGKTMFSYEVTSKQPISALFEGKKLSIMDLQLIFGGFVQVMEDMAEFLLNPENLVIAPEHMYVDVEKKEVFFCYLPGYDHDVRGQFQTLTEYILPKLDHEDGKAVMLGYGVYRRALEESFHLEHIKEELYRVRNEEQEGKKKEPVLREESKSFLQREKKDIPKGREEASFQEEPKDLWRMDAKEPPKKRNEKKEGMKKAAGCGAGAAIFLILVFFKAFGYLPWLTVEAMAGGCLILLGGGTLFYSLYTKKQKKSEPARAEEKETGFSGKEQQIQRTEMEEMESLLKNQEEKAGEMFRTDGSPKEFGETVALSANVKRGPASLVSKEPGELAKIYLKEDITVVGKLETAADAVIPLPTVSRVHAKIRKKGEEYFLCDLNSRNGTSVNGRMLKNEEEYLLQDEDEVDFAQARYIFLK